MRLKNAFRSEGVVAAVSTLAAFMGYGGWAFWLNLQAGWEIALLPALLHGLYAAILTLMLYGAIVWCYKLCVERTRYPAVLTWLVVSLFSVVTPLLIQVAADNMHPVLTVLPGAIVGQFYILGLLHRQRRALQPVSGELRFNGELNH